MKHLILMLEYDEDDQYITLQHFKEHQRTIDLRIVGSSEEVISYLQDCKAGRERFPSLLLMNYNSTPLNAAELISKVKADAALRHIPAVVLSGIVNEEIVRGCYAKGASSFIQKPALMEETSKKINNFIDYWFHTVELS
jgi:response regulator RpfG family c-di-GMP phosphodiesterase